MGECTRDQIARIYTWTLAHPDAEIRSARTTSTRPWVLLDEDSWDAVSGWEFYDRIDLVSFCRSTQFGIDFEIAVSRQVVAA